MKIILILFIFLSSPVVFSKTIQLCTDEDGWGSYSYRSNNNIAKGATVELIDHIFNNLNLQYSISLIPWKRCLYRVSHYDKSKSYEIYFDATKNKARDLTAYSSKAIYKVHPGFFYSIDKFPQGPKYDKISELNQYRLCGITGHNLDPWYEAGIKFPVEADLLDYKNALKNIAGNRCDLLLTWISPLLGNAKKDKYEIDSRIRYKKIKKIKPSSFHIYIAKKSPRGKELLLLINQQLELLKKNGTIKKIYKKHIPKSDNGF